MKKRIAVPYVFLGLAAAIIIFFLFKTNRLVDSLEASDADRSEMKRLLNEQQQLLSIDSLLLNGNYNTALRSYNETWEASKENNMSIPLRIAIAKKLSKFNAAYDAEKERLENELADSVELDKMATANEIRQFDAVSFELEKAKVQLAKMRSQLREKSFGQYLTFKSKKDNQMHYVGNVKNEKANGFGIAILDTGSRYQGEWKDNERHGEGTFYWPDGEYYVGSYANDLRNGKGSYYWPNGEKYVGQWRDDKRNGEGTFYDSNGKVVTQGFWEEDKLVEETDKKKK